MSLDDLFTPTSKQQTGEHLGSKIAETTFDTGVEVRTVIVAHSQFQTQVSGGMFDGETQDYSTKEEAIVGHIKWSEHASKPIPEEIQELVNVLSSSESEGNLYRLAAHLVLNGYSKQKVGIE